MVETCCGRSVTTIIIMATTYKYSIRRDLKRGKTFGFFQIRTAKSEATQGHEVELVNPDTHNIVFVNCKLHNKSTQALKIFNGEHKKPCAWILCEDYIVMPKSDVIMSEDELVYNPRLAPNWVIDFEDVDNKCFDTIETKGTKLFTTK